MCEQVLDMREAALGANHPEVAACVNNLAVLLKTVGRHEEAQHLYERSIAIKERSMGPTHPQVHPQVHPDHPFIHHMPVAGGGSCSAVHSPSCLLTCHHGLLKAVGYIK